MKGEVSILITKKFTMGGLRLMCQLPPYTYNGRLRNQLNRLHSLLCTFVYARVHCTCVCGVWILAALTNKNIFMKLRKMYVLL